MTSMMNMNVRKKEILGVLIQGEGGDSKALIIVTYICYQLMICQKIKMLYLGIRMPSKQVIKVYNNHDYPSKIIPKSLLEILEMP